MPIPLLAGVAIAQGVLGAANVVGNIIKGNKAADEAKKLRAQRKAFKTSEEIYDIANATEANAQQGYDATTLDYLTNQIDRAANSAYGTAKRLGADPNDLSAIFDQQIQATMKVGAENHALNMENFGKYLGAKELLAKNLDAEWASAQGLIKDDLQAANTRRQEATAGVSNGINTIISAASNYATGKLYQDRTDALAGGAEVAAPVRLGNESDAASIERYAGGDTGSLSRAVQSVSNIVTPTAGNTQSFNPATQRIRIIVGYDLQGNPIYR